MDRRQVLQATGLGLLGLASGGLPAAASPTGRASWTGLVHEYFDSRAQQVTAAGTRTPRSAPRLSVARGAAERLASERLQGWRKRLDEMHGGYASSRTRVMAVEAPDLGSSATRTSLLVRETTELAFAHPGSGPRSTSYVADHRLTLVLDRGVWRIDEATYLAPNAYSDPVTQFGGEDVARGSQPDVLPGTALRGKATALHSVETSTSARAAADAERASARAAASYDYPAMVAYARKWYNSFNGSYPKYSDDCTNFVSQCVRAGRWATVGSYPADSRIDNRKWWYGSVVQTSSYTWGGAQNWHTFALGSGRTSIASSLDNMWLADVLLYDFNHDGTKDHTQICTSVNGTRKYMTQHSGPYKDKPLSEILADPTNAKAWYYVHRT